MPPLVAPPPPLHGLGGAQDLPVPASLAITGGTAALVVSFCVLILAWRSPRYAGGSSRGREVPRALAGVVDSPGLRAALRAVGFVFAAYATWALVAGPDLVTNPVFGVFYVWVWVGIVPASLLFGRIYRAVNPLRTVNLALVRITGGEPGRGVVDYPARFGYWPAALGLFAFVWQELVNPEAVYLDSIRLWLAAYAAIMLVGAAVFGDEWITHADPFEVYSDLLAKLSPWARRADGALVWRSPLANLATLRPRAGLVATVSVLLGSTAFDSFMDTFTWLRFARDLGWGSLLTNSLGLLVFCLVVAATFTVATRSTRIDPALGHGHRDLPTLFAHSVVPIVVGYMTAHYLSYLVEQGQTTLIQLSDPMVTGQNLLGTADWSVNYWLSYHPTLLASVKVLAIVVGHVVGVVAAHDRALEILRRRDQVTGQLGLLVVMVGYTATGLYLLFGA